MNSQLSLPALALLSAFSILTGCAQEQPRTCAGNPFPKDTVKPTATTNGSIELTGSGLSRPTTFSYEQLCDMEMTQLDRVLMQRSHAPDQHTDWQGPALDTLLAAAEIKPGPMNFTVRSADGYTVNCTHEDLKGAIVAILNGQGARLLNTEKNYHHRLIAPTQTGNYWVRDTTKIIVTPAGS